MVLVLVIVTPPCVVNEDDMKIDVAVNGAAEYAHDVDAGGNLALARSCWPRCQC